MRTNSKTTVKGKGGATRGPRNWKGTRTGTAGRKEKPRARGKARGFKGRIEHMSSRSRKLLSVGMLAALFVGTSLSVGTMLAGTPATIHPTDVSGISMQVNDPSSGKLLWGGSSSGEAPNIAWADNSSFYSPVKAWVSDTWHSTATGGYLPNNTNVSPTDIYWLGAGSGTINSSECIYHYITYDTVSVAVRTGPDINYHFQETSNWVSPMAGIQLPLDNAGFQSGTFSPHGSETQGALSMYSWCGNGVLYPPSTKTLGVVGGSLYQTNTMSGISANAPNEISDALPSTPAAKIPCGMKTSDACLVPMTWPGTWSNGKVFTATQANQDVLNYCTVQPVTVTVTVTIHANSEAVKAYDVKWPCTWPNGTQGYIRVNTVSAVVGFGCGGGVVKETGLYSGIVPNVNYANQIPTFELQHVTANSNEVPAQCASTGNANNPSGQSTAPATLTGSIAVNSNSGWTSNIVQTGGVVVGTMTSDQTTTISQPNLNDASSGGLSNNLGMPTDLTFTITNTLSPQVTVNDASALVSWEIANELGTGGSWQDIKQSATVWFPYGVSALNYAVIRNITVPVDIFSERSVQGISSSGRPIDPKSIIDQDANSFWNNPNNANYIEVQHAPEGLGPTPVPWWGWVILGFVILVLVWVVFRVLGGIGSSAEHLRKGFGKQQQD